MTSIWFSNADFIKKIIASMNVATNECSLRVTRENVCIDGIFKRNTGFVELNIQPTPSKFEIYKPATGVVSPANSQISLPISKWLDYFIIREHDSLRMTLGDEQLFMSTENKKNNNQQLTQIHILDEVRPHLIANYTERNPILAKIVWRKSSFDEFVRPRANFLDVVTFYFDDMEPTKFQIGHQPIDETTKNKKMITEYSLKAPPPTKRSSKTNVNTKTSENLKTKSFLLGAKPEPETTTTPDIKSISIKSSFYQTFQVSNLTLASYVRGSSIDEYITLEFYKEMPLHVRFTFEKEAKGSLDYYFAPTFDEENEEGDANNENS